MRLRFNTAGPCIPGRHYMLPALDRLPEVRRLDLCVEYRGRRYAVEVKTSKNFAGEKSYAQLADYLGTLDLAEGWMTVFDTGPDNPWEKKLYRRDITFAEKTIHVVEL